MERERSDRKREKDCYEERESYEKEKLREFVMEREGERKRER